MPPAVPQGAGNGELYRGAHWLRARGIAARWPGIELWAMSAGLGLRHHTDPAVAYEATFHAMPFAPATVWGSLTARPRWRAAAPPRLS